MQLHAQTVYIQIERFDLVGYHWVLNTQYVRIVEYRYEILNAQESRICPASQFAVY